MNRGRLIAPYRGVCYHLKEYSTRPPQNAKELFNLRHASLCNAIGRAFGVLKKRFPIIGSTTEPTYSVDTQTEIILTCCIIHNYFCFLFSLICTSLNLLPRSGWQHLFLTTLRWQIFGPKIEQ
jgi:hypothetical protein